MKKQIIVALFLLLFGSTLQISAQNKTEAKNVSSKFSTESGEVRKAMEAFVEAFNNLEWEKYSAAFADDATVFSPSDASPRRSTGRAEFEINQKKTFEEGRQRKAQPPYLNIMPKDLLIQMLGANAAIVTFHLEGENVLRRRTFVLQKIKGKWLIVHLHASGIELPKKTTGGN
jgi:hypothetical protein